MMRIFQGLKKHQADLFRSCQKFFLISAVEVFILLYVFIYQTKMMCFPSFFWGGGWVYSYLDMVLVCPESFSSFYLFAVGKSVQ